jgi:hypothetical protein
MSQPGHRRRAGDFFEGALSLRIAAQTECSYADVEMNRGARHAFGNGGLKRIESRRVVTCLERAAAGLEMLGGGFAVSVRADGRNKG